MAISLKIESLSEVKLSCECTCVNRCVTSPGWDAEGAPLVDRVECQCGSVWEVLVGNWSTTAWWEMAVTVGRSAVHGRILARSVWVVSRVLYPESIADSSITNAKEKVWVRHGRVLEVHGDGNNDVTRREFPTLEQGHLDQASPKLFHFKVQGLRSGCIELAETGMVLQPLRGHHFVIKQRVWGRAAVHLWRETAALRYMWDVLRADHEHGHFWYVSMFKV